MQTASYADAQLKRTRRIPNAINSTPPGLFAAINLRVHLLIYTHSYRRALDEKLFGFQIFPLTLHKREARNSLIFKARNIMLSRDSCVCVCVFMCTRKQARVRDWMREPN